MTDKIVLKIVIGVSTIILALILPARVLASTEIEEGKLVVFVQTGCPYCNEVEEFVNNNGLSDRVEFLDMRENPEHAQYYNEVCENAGIPVLERGTPLLYDGENTIDSADKIEEFLRDEFGLPEEDESDEEARSNRIVLIILGIGIVSAVLFIAITGKGKQ